jgi:ribosomal protein S18 acetylase RimI-like enzyme
MDDMLYREFAIEDYDPAYTLWSTTTGVGLSEADSEEKIQRFLERNPGLSHVCVIDGRVVGTILCGHDGRRGYIYHLVIDAEYRSLGIGRALVEMSLTALEREGITKCHLFVFAVNERGMRFWNRMGFKKRHDILVFSRKP